MNLIRRNQRNLIWNPFREFETLQDEMDRLFDFSLSRWPGKTAAFLEGGWGPAIDVYDEKDNLIVKADLPGVSKEEIEVTVEIQILPFDDTYTLLYSEGHEAARGQHDDRRAKDLATKIAPKRKIGETQLFSKGADDREFLQAFRALNS